jgi:hypothetical protein
MTMPGEADGDADQPDGQRNARAVEDARQQCAERSVPAGEERALLGRQAVEIA